MGLDMYLYRQRAGEPDVKRQLTVSVSDPNWMEQYREVKERVEVAYWRKANAIHAWFVEAVQDGVDECQYSAPFRREVLAGLVERCRRILDGRTDPADALPTREGFFFGSTEYDEGYEQDLKETIRQLEPLLAERNDDEFVYHSSW